METRIRVAAFLLGGLLGGCWTSGPAVAADANGDEADAMRPEAEATDADVDDGPADVPAFPACRRLVPLEPSELGPVADRGTVQSLTHGPDGWLALTWGYVPGSCRNLFHGCECSQTSLQVFALDASLENPGPMHAIPECEPIRGTTASFPPCWGWTGGGSGPAKWVDGAFVVLVPSLSTDDASGVPALQRFSRAGVPIGAPVLLEPPDAAVGPFYWSHAFAASDSVVLMGGSERTDPDEGVYASWWLRYDANLTPLDVLGPVGRSVLPPGALHLDTLWDGRGFHSLVQVTEDVPPPTAFRPVGLLDLGADGSSVRFETFASSIPVDNPFLRHRLRGILVPGVGGESFAYFHPVGVASGPDEYAPALLDADGTLLGPGEATYPGVGDQHHLAWDGTAVLVVLPYLPSGRRCWDDPLCPETTCPSEYGSMYDACYLGDGPIVWSLRRFGRDLALTEETIEISRTEGVDDALPDCDFVVTDVVAGLGMIAYAYYYYDAPTGLFRSAIGRFACADP